MAIRGGFYVALVATGLLVGAVAVPGPAVASTFISGTGKWGVYQTSDQQAGPKGAKCLYETNSSVDLDRIKVRPPQMFGFYATNTWVGWKYKILRRGPNNVGWTVVHKSSAQKDKARETYAADDFTWRTWTAPEGPTGRYKVRIVMLWYEPGTTSDVEGKVVREYDWYVAKLIGAPDSDSIGGYDYCNDTLI